MIRDYWRSFRRGLGRLSCGLIVIILFVQLLYLFRVNSNSGTQIIDVKSDLPDLKYVLLESSTQKQKAPEESKYKNGSILDIINEIKKEKNHSRIFPSHKLKDNNTDILLLNISKDESGNEKIFVDTELNMSENMTEEEFVQEYTRYCHLMSKSLKLDSSKKLCPCMPSGLVGPVDPYMTVPTMKHLEDLHRELSLGGSWSPAECQPRHTVAIIVPYRDREEHLLIFLQYIHTIMQRQMLSYMVFVVEQEGHGVFNKASMMNIGFLEARKVANFSCYIFHDVDVMALDDRNMYTCAQAPRHVGAYMSKFNFTLKYNFLFGAATAFTEEQFLKVNGFSNRFYGWGGEDDDMSRRVDSVGYIKVRYPKSIAKFDMIPHKRDEGNPYNDRAAGMGGRTGRMRHLLMTKDGVTKTRYIIHSMSFNRLYTHIVAEIPAGKRGVRAAKRRSQWPEWKINLDIKKSDNIDKER